MFVDIGSVVWTIELATDIPDRHFPKSNIFGFGGLLNYYNVLKL